MTTWVHSPNEGSAGWSYDNAYTDGTIVTVESISVSDGGSAYVINDLLYLSNDGNQDATLKVTAGTITNGRRVTGVSIEDGGSGYIVGSRCTTTTDSANGSGCILTIATVNNKT